MIYTALKIMSKLLYKALNTPHLKEVVSNIRDVCNNLGIDFFEVCALARNSWHIQNEALSSNISSDNQRFLPVNQAGGSFGYSSI